MMWEILPPKSLLNWASAFLNAVQVFNKPIHILLRTIKLWRQLHLYSDSAAGIRLEWKSRNLPPLLPWECGPFKLLLLQFAKAQVPHPCQCKRTAAHTQNPSKCHEDHSYKYSFLYVTDYRFHTLSWGLLTRAKDHSSLKEIAIPKF